jgi:hypothetical protein
LENSQALFNLLGQIREISVWRLTPSNRLGGKRKCPDLDASVSKDNGRPADRVARAIKRLSAETELLEKFAVLGEVVLLQIIEELATTAGHLEKTAARMEILAVRAQVLGQMIDAGSEQSHLNFGRAGVLFVSLILGDDLWFNDCGRHGLWI